MAEYLVKSLTTPLRYATRKVKYTLQEAIAMLDFHDPTTQPKMFG